jgi:preprotein translocase subunit SecG
MDVDIVITLITVFHIVIAILLVITVLLQPGKGGDLGSMFGGGMSDSIFGSSGAVPFLTKTTRVLAVLFIVTSLSLGFFLTRGYKSSVVTDNPSAQIHDEFDEVPEGVETGTQGVSSTSAEVTGEESSSAGEASEDIPKNDPKN